MNIYNGKNKMRREINSKMLKKGQQKLSTRLGDRVIVREKWSTNAITMFKNCEPFAKADKGRTVSELALTPLGRMLTKSRFELILGHSPQTLTTRIVRKLYPRNLKHIRNKLQCDRNARTLNASEEKRY